MVEHTYNQATWAVMSTPLIIFYIYTCLLEVCTVDDKESFVFRGWTLSQSSKSKYLNSGCTACNANTISLSTMVSDC